MPTKASGFKEALGSAFCEVFLDQNPLITDPNVFGTKYTFQLRPSPYSSDYQTITFLTWEEAQKEATRIRLSLPRDNRGKQALMAGQLNRARTANRECEEYLYIFDLFYRDNNLKKHSIGSLFIMARVATVFDMMMEGIQASKEDDDEMG